MWRREELPSLLPSHSVDATRDNGRKGRLVNHYSNVVTKVIEMDDTPYLCLMAGRDLT